MAKLYAAIEAAIANTTLNAYFNIDNNINNSWEGIFISQSHRNQVSTTVGETVTWSEWVSQSVSRQDPHLPWKSQQQVGWGTRLVSEWQGQAMIRLRSDKNEGCTCQVMWCDSAMQKWGTLSTSAEWSHSLERICSFFYNLANFQGNPI